MSADKKAAVSAAKVPYSVLPKRMFAGVARVMARGAKTYAPGNWYEATFADGAADRYTSALDRHVTDMQEPNGTWSRESLAHIDADSGLPAIDHAIASLMILRGILTKEGMLPADPGEGKPVERKDGWANVQRINGPDLVRRQYETERKIMQTLEQLDGEGRTGVTITNQSDDDRRAILRLLNEGRIVYRRGGLVRAGHVIREDAFLRGVRCDS